MEISKTLGVSTPTLSRRIAELRYEKGILTKYRELQGLQLTTLQFKALEAITDEKIQNASLLELAKCFSVLAKVQKAIMGNGKERWFAGISVGIGEKRKVMIGTYL